MEMIIDDSAAGKATLTGKASSGSMVGIMDFS